MISQRLFQLIQSFWGWEFEVSPDVILREAAVDVRIGTDCVGHIFHGFFIQPRLVEITTISTIVTLLEARLS